MKSLLLVSAIVLACCRAEAQERFDGLTISGRYGTSTLDATVSLDNLLKQKEWNGNTDDSPPISCVEALKVTRDAVHTAFPETRTLSLNRSLILQEIGGLTIDEGKQSEYIQTFRNCWIYVVQYNYLPPASDHPELERISIPVVVLMDGTIHVATKRTKKAPNQALQPSSGGCLNLQKSQSPGTG